MESRNYGAKGGYFLAHTALALAFGNREPRAEGKPFCDFLPRKRQAFRQLLPINPTEGGQGHSPYSSTSSRAGNVLLISPELLVKEGLITTEFIAQYQLPNDGKTDYTLAERIKKDIFQKAWLEFQNKKEIGLQSDF